MLQNREIRRTPKLINACLLILLRHGKKSREH
jgi:hypothetical protein